MIQCIISITPVNNIDCRGPRQFSKCNYSLLPINIALDVSLVGKCHVCIQKEYVNTM